MPQDKRIVEILKGKIGETFKAFLGEKESVIIMEAIAQAILQEYIRKDEVERRMISHRVEDIIHPDGSKWRCLVYKDDTKEQCEWICYEHIEPFIKALSTCQEAIKECLTRKDW